MPKILVHDIDFSNGAHGDKVVDYFLHDAPNDWSVVKYESSYSDVEEAVDQAIAEECIMIIRSATGAWNHKDQWKRALNNGILPVNAHGSNTDGQELSEPPYIAKFLCTAGAENPDDSDEETSFGPGLEMDAEPYDGSIAQSWATPTIAAAIARQYNRGYTLQEARMFVRQACDDYSDGWNKETGYGTFVSGEPIPKSGLDIHDPFEIEIENLGNGFRKVTWVHNDINPETVGVELLSDESSVYKTENTVGYYHNQNAHTLTVRSYSTDSTSVGADYELELLSEKNIDREVVDFDLNYAPVNEDELPEGLSHILQLKIDNEWEDWDKELPKGFYKARIQVYAEDNPDNTLFTSEIFDVTRIQ